MRRSDAHNVTDESVEERAGRRVLRLQGGRAEGYWLVVRAPEGQAVLADRCANREKTVRPSEAC
jgi:hypothetical protein